MVKRALVPIDGSEQSKEACNLVFEEFPNATLVLLHVVNPAEASYGAQASIPSFSEEWYKEEKERAEKTFADIKQVAREHGVDVKGTVEVGKPSQVIVDYVEDHEIDHILMGSHGREGVSRILLGSVAETVMRRSPVPVTVVR
jgi:nucleotide-binding universal stress UspA family protein